MGLRSRRVGFKSVIDVSRSVLCRLGTWVHVLRCVAKVTACLMIGLPAVAHTDIEIQLEDVTRQIASDPSDAVLFLKRGELHRVHEDWPAAAADYDNARKLDPKLYLLDFCVGKMRLESGQPKAALTYLNKFLAKEPDDAEGLRLRGHALVRLGDPLAAAVDYSRSVELRTRDGRTPPPDLFIARARALVAAGAKHHEEALQGLKEGLELLSRPVTLELEALEVELILKRTDDAVARVDRLAAGAARPEPWLVRRGEILEQASRLVESRRAYLAALEGIMALPQTRRKSGPLAELEQQARAGLGRIPEDHSESTGDER